MNPQKAIGVFFASIGAIITLMTIDTRRLYSIARYINTNKILLSEQDIEGLVIYGPIGGIIFILIGVFFYWTGTKEMLERAE